jgi:hypothetical protein
MRSLLLSGVLAACGGDDGIALGGDVNVTYGGEAPIPMAVGAAVADHQAGADDPDRALVVFGTRAISCETTLEQVLPRGTYTLFEITRATGAQTPSVGVLRVESGGSHFNATSGDVQITLLDDDRLTGTVAMTTEDADVGVISVAGTFDVVRCF